MENYRCFACDHECRVDTGSMYGAPEVCIVTGKPVEWTRVTDISQPFRKHIKKCAETVARDYPSWKKDCLGK